jgi:alkanesulfonate monooxygenase SsuD/methylene tetrahydromethanopterin reductase-like flavin-dependent oxidoreductase (luciferase family)
VDFGILNLPMHPPENDLNTSYHNDVLKFVWADELGFKEGWIGEHYTIPWQPVPAGDIFVAHVAGQTENIRLGTGIHVLSFSDPRLVALRIAYLDHLTKGRLNFGIGAGGTPLDMEWFNCEPGEHQRRTSEAIDVILRIWTEREPFEHKGEFWNFKMPTPIPEYPMGYHIYPYQKPFPQIMMSGLQVHSPSLRLAGEKGWWASSVQFHPAANLLKQWEMYADGARAAAKKTDRANWRVAREIFVAPTDAEARDLVKGSDLHRSYEYWITVLKGMKATQLLKIDPEMPDEHLTVDYFMKNIWIVGSPDTVSEKLIQLYKEVGGWGTTLQIQYDWAPMSVWRRNMQLLMDEVHPNVRDLVPDED